MPILDRETTIEIAKLAVDRVTAHDDRITLKDVIVMSLLATIAVLVIATFLILRNTDSQRFLMESFFGDRLVGQVGDCLVYKLHAQRAWRYTVVRSRQVDNQTLLLAQTFPNIPDNGLEVCKYLGDLGIQK